MILYVMGVSGSGKSTIGARLAERLGIKFADGDNYHPKANKEKMSRGIPLDDEDRRPWIAALNELAKATDAEGSSIVIVCSALKAKYREWLSKELDPGRERFILLDVPREIIMERLKARQHEFMSPTLLASQFDILERPPDAICVVNQGLPDEVVDRIIEQLPATL